MTLIETYLEYISVAKRYSPLTVEAYRAALESYVLSCGADDDASLLASLTPIMVRNWEVELLNGGLSARSVNQHMSALSSFCRFLVSRQVLSGNPVLEVKRPQLSRRLPVFYRKDAMASYLEATRMYSDGTFLELYPCVTPLSQKLDKHIKELYEKILSRMILSLLYCTAVRRAELISLNISDFDSSRSVLRVRGKGDKMREIPLVSSICEEISLYLKSVETMVVSGRCPADPLLVTPSQRRLYPMYVDRVVKKELGDVKDIKGRRSPHVLRHTLATELLENGSDLNSIKEMLGHGSLAATQVYTHNTVAQLKKVYESAHPRAKNGGKNGD